MKSIKLMEMLEEVDYSRRDFLSVITMCLAAAEFSVSGSADTQFSNTTRTAATSIKPEADPLFGTLKQINAGVLNVGYVEAGPNDGSPVAPRNIAPAGATSLHPPSLSC